MFKFPFFVLGGLLIPLTLSAGSELRFELRGSRLGVVDSFGEIQQWRTSDPVSDWDKIRKGLVLSGGYE